MVAWVILPSCCPLSELATSGWETSTRGTPQRAAVAVSRNDSSAPESRRAELFRDPPSHCRVTGRQVRWRLEESRRDTPTSASCSTRGAWSFYWTRPREMTLLTAPEAGPRAQALVALSLADPGPVYHHRLRLAPGPGWWIVGSLTPWSNRRAGRVGDGLVGPSVAGSEIASNDGDPPDARQRG